MKWPSVSSLDSALESSPSLHSPADPGHLSPPASSPRPSRGHRRSASCGSPLSGGTGEGASRSAGCGGGVSGPGSSDCRIIRVQMELGEDGSVYKSILVRAPGAGQGGKDLTSLGFSLGFGWPGVNCSFCGTGAIVGCWWQLCVSRPHPEFSGAVIQVQSQQFSHREVLGTMWAV